NKKLKSSLKTQAPSQPVTAPSVAPQAVVEATGVEQLTDIFILLDHISGRIQDYLDSGGKNANNVMGILMSEGFSLVPKINAALKDADKIKQEVADLSFSEFQTLIRTYVERPAYDATKAILVKLIN
ncbi:MAG: hypothetical protein EBX40_07220, partial [Gammaproteobacteria bacterium]|nr:hypothetical protein [Gammaproteobacteria bacterium]